MGFTVQIHNSDRTITFSIAFRSQDRLPEYLVFWASAPKSPKGPRTQNIFSEIFRRMRSREDILSRYSRDHILLKISSEKPFEDFELKLFLLKRSSIQISWELRLLLKTKYSCTVFWQLDKDKNRKKCTSFGTVRQNYVFDFGIRFGNDLFENENRNYLPFIYIS